MLCLIVNEDDTNRRNTNRKKLLANFKLIFFYIKQKDLVYVSTVIMKIYYKWHWKNVTYLFREMIVSKFKMLKEGVIW